MNAKKSAAEMAVKYIEQGMMIGLGSGSTAEYAIRKIGEMVSQGLNIIAVASSLKTEILAKQSGISIIGFKNINRIDLTIDGADEVDDNGNLLKGGGGALLREKILAFNSKQFIVVTDESKRVNTLGKFNLAVEIIPFARELTMKRLEELGTNPILRQRGNQNFISDNGNLVVDCNFYPITDPAALNAMLHLIPGVVETGLFSNHLVHKIIIGYHDGSVLEFDTTQTG